MWYYGYYESSADTYERYYEDVSDTLDAIKELRYAAEDEGNDELAAELMSYENELETLDYAYADDVADILSNAQMFLINNK